MLFRALVSYSTSKSSRAIFPPKYYKLLSHLCSIRPFQKEDPTELFSRAEILAQKLTPEQEEINLNVDELEAEASDLKLEKSGLQEPPKVHFFSALFSALLPSSFHHEDHIFHHDIAT